MNYLLVCLASFLSCSGQLCQKQAVNVYFQYSRNRFYWMWLSCSLSFLVFGLYVWLLVLQRVPVGIAYPMLSLNYIFLLLSANWLWKEPITKLQVLGVICIIAGIVILSLNR